MSYNQNLDANCKHEILHDYDVISDNIFSWSFYNVYS